MAVIDLKSLSARASHKHPTSPPLASYPKANGRKMTMLQTVAI